jgi:hypothetical protein
MYQSCCQTCSHWESQPSSIGATIYLDGKNVPSCTPWQDGGFRYPCDLIQVPRCSNRNRNGTVYPARALGYLGVSDNKKNNKRTSVWVKRIEETKTTISKRTREQNTCMCKSRVKRASSDQFRNSRIPLRDKEKEHHRSLNKTHKYAGRRWLAWRLYLKNNPYEPEPGQSKTEGRARMHWKTNPKSDQQPSDSVRRQLLLCIRCWFVNGTRVSAFSALSSCLFSALSSCAPLTRRHLGLREATWVSAFSGISTFLALLSCARAAY